MSAGSTAADNNPVNFQGLFFYRLFLLFFHFFIFVRNIYLYGLFLLFLVNLVKWLTLRIQPKAMAVNKSEVPPRLTQGKG